MLVVVEGPDPLSRVREARLTVLVFVVLVVASLCGNLAFSFCFRKLKNRVVGKWVGVDVATHTACAALLRTWASKRRTSLPSASVSCYRRRCSFALQQKEAGDSSLCYLSLTITRRLLLSLRRLPLLPSLSTFAIDFHFYRLPPLCRFWIAYIYLDEVSNEHFRALPCHDLTK
jgi:hypothetical protein